MLNTTAIVQANIVVIIVAVQYL